MHYSEALERASGSLSVSKETQVIQYSERQQDGDLMATEELGDYQIRFLIHIDSSYSFQSRARVEVWSPTTLSWNEVAHLVDVPKPTDYTVKRRAAEKAQALLREEARRLLAA